ncbi:unnamed protein product, partial [Staurois parvus]
MFSTAVWKDSPRTVINSLFLTVLMTFPSIQRLKQLYGVNVPELSEIVYFLTELCTYTFCPACNYYLFSSYFFFFFFSSSSSSSSS